MKKGILSVLIFLWGAATPAQEIQHQAVAVNIEVPVRVYKSGENELASATGGLTESSSNAEKAFQKAVKASQIYYLVYYKPKQYAAD
jgi:hypothetical protein